MKSAAIIYFIILLFLYQNNQAQSVNVPVDHWAYDFVERMEAKGFIRSLNRDIRPISREQFVDYINEIENYHTKYPDCFSKIENEYLERLKGEFDKELEDSSFIVEDHVKENHFYTFEKYNDKYFFVDVLTGITSTVPFDRNKSETIYQPYYGTIVRGAYSNIHFYSDNRIFSEWGRDPYIQSYTASQGYPLNTTRDSSRATWDVSKSYVCFDIRNINFLFGREKVHWGPSRFGSLMFSGLAPDFDQLRILLDFHPFTFIWLHGSLSSDFSNKWISSHRLAVSLTDKIDIALQETVIYGERGVETAYLNPLIPYLIAEHTLGDRDNVSLGFDCNINLVQGIKIFGELFIDDLFAPWELFSNYWGNKYAFNIGTYCIDPLHISNSEIRIEYTRIEPYVYTHKKKVNIYRNYNIGLGSFLEPNSDCWLGEWRKYLDSFLYYRIQFYQSRHGKGNITEPHKESDGDTKKFLDGVVEKYNKISSGISGEILQDFRFSCDVIYIDTNNYLNIKQNDQTWWEIILEINVNW